MLFLKVKYEHKLAFETARARAKIVFVLVCVLKGG